MVAEAEEFADQDAKEKDKIEARNGLESYLYNAKSSISDMANIDEDDKESVLKTIDEALEWMEDTPAAEKDEYDEKQKEVESVVNPIMKKAYEGAAGGAGDGGMPPDDDWQGEDVDGGGPEVEEVD